jgi:hypothetical protein
MGRTTVDWQGALGTALAALGMAVSVYSAYQGWRARHPRLRVRLAYGTAGVAGASGRSHAGALGLVICVINRGAVEVTIEAVGLLGPDGRRLAVGEPRGTLAPGEALRARERAWFWVEPAEVARALATSGYAGLVELRAACVDGVGDAYRSGPVPFDVGAGDSETRARPTRGRKRGVHGAHDEHASHPPSDRTLDPW